MKVGPGARVTMEFNLVTNRPDDRRPEDRFVEVSFVFGRGEVLPGVEDHLRGREAGEVARFTVPAERGYGVYDPNLIQFVGREHLDPEAEYVVDRVFRTAIDGRVVRFTVNRVMADGIMVDLNHPLAGEDLDFTVRIMDVRPATTGDIAAGGGHVHDENQRRPG